MSQGANTQGTKDPTELWKQWYEPSYRLWSSVLDGGKETFVDPYGLYQAWLKSVGEAQEHMKATAFGVADPKELWKQWFDATTEG